MATVNSTDCGLEFLIKLNLLGVMARAKKYDVICQAFESGLWVGFMFTCKSKKSSISLHAGIVEGLLSKDPYYEPPAFVRNEVLGCLNGLLDEVLGVNKDLGDIEYAVSKEGGVSVIGEGLHLLSPLSLPGSVLLQAQNLGVTCTLIKYKGYALEFLHKGLLVNGVALFDGEAQSLYCKDVSVPIIPLRDKVLGCLKGVLDEILVNEITSSEPSSSLGNNSVKDVLNILKKKVTQETPTVDVDNKHLLFVSNLGTKEKMALLDVASHQDILCPVKGTSSSSTYYSLVMLSTPGGLKVNMAGRYENGKLSLRLEGDSSYLTALESPLAKFGFTMKAPHLSSHMIVDTSQVASLYGAILAEIGFDSISVFGDIKAIC